MIELDEVQQLRDDALIERLSRSVQKDRTVAVRLLVEMGEVMARGLHREYGFSSMYDFATRRLGMSEGEAGLRIRAAKVGRAFPEALELLGRGEVNLSTLSALLPVLTHDSIHLLHAARGKSKREVQALIATHAPKPDAPDSMHKLPPPRPQRVSARAQPTAGAMASPLHPLEVHGSTKPAAMVQLSSGRHRICFTGSDRVRELVHEAQELRRHRFPAGDLEPLFERALELLVAEEKKRMFALTDKPRATHATRRARHSRHIPHAVRREVRARTDGQCGFVAADGVRCSARGRLQFHHVVPFARGGASEAENLVLLCQAHNALQAERDYGRTVIRECIERGSAGFSGSGARMKPGARAAAPGGAHRSARGGRAAMTLTAARQAPGTRDVPR